MVTGNTMHFIKNMLYYNRFFTSGRTLTLGICAGASQIPLMADEKLHTRTV